MAQGKNGEAPNIIIKKIKKIEGGHHGGAWKVAYADFVTAMMAFFLMLWLLSSTSKEQKEGISEYFSVTMSSSATGGGEGMMGGTSTSTEKSISDGSPSVTMALSAPAPPPASESDTESETPPAGGTLAAELSSADDAAPAVGVGEKTAGGGGAHEMVTSLNAQRTTATPTEEALNKAIANREMKKFELAEKELKQAISDIPELAQLSGQLIIDHTPEGMRIQLVDEADRPMFKEGTAEPYVRTRAIFKEIAKVINKLPNRIAISGHTDASAFQREDGYGNWELSMDRAMFSRRLLQQSGVPDTRFFEVTGKASTEPLFPEDPYISGNRRISMTMMREEPALAPNALGAD
ncbi:MAG: flagellar motor protein MotB [Alphaproteobacteria bacterium]